jgi:hypothetical protein
MTVLVKTEFVTVTDHTQGGIPVPAKIEYRKTGTTIKQYLIYL